MKQFAACLFVAALTVQAKPLQVKDLPTAVQKTVEEQAKGAEIKNITKEKEKGVVQYEVETIVSGKHRDFNVDAKGALIVVEEEVAIDSIPAAARAAILTKVGQGKLGMVESVLQGGATSYEAAYTESGGKKHSVIVKADGTVSK